MYYVIILVPRSDTMTFAIHTFGCKVNIYESEYVINLLTQNNYNMIDFNDSKEADIYIINTCTVTNEADKKDRKLINSTKNKHKDSILIVMGCYSQLNPNTIDADIFCKELCDTFNTDVSIIEEIYKHYYMENKRWKAV